MLQVFAVVSQVMRKHTWRCIWHTRIAVVLLLMYIIRWRIVLYTFFEVFGWRLSQICKILARTVLEIELQRRPSKIRCEMQLDWLEKWNNSLRIHFKLQKQPSRGVLRKKCSQNMQKIYRRTPMPRCDFNKVALQLYWFWNRASAWVFSCKFAAYFQNIFSKEHHWMAASEARNCTQFFC